MSDIPVLKTPRFTLRPLQRNDSAALFPTLGDESQCRYLTRPAFANEQELWDWLAAPDWNGRTWIAQNQQDQVVGRFVAVPAHEKAICEIGYITCQQYQGQGVARECMSAVIAQLIEREQHRKLIAEVDIDNVPSLRLLERLGFTREAHLREHETTHIGIRDVLLYGLLKTQWQPELIHRTHA